MKITHYTSMERTILAADGGGVRERWRYGLRLLRDPEAMADKSLRHGVTEVLIDAATSRGMKLSAREIQWRVQCARAYPTESQMRNAITDFGTWFALIQAGFPPYPQPIDEPLADHRTQAERDHARAQQMLLAIGPQERLFSLDEFEPDLTTLAELWEYTRKQDEITERFARVGRERNVYLRTLTQAVDGDVTKTWQVAHKAAFGEDAQAV
jgi:hypothetical protein